MCALVLTIAPSRLRVLLYPAHQQKAYHHAHPPPSTIPIAITINTEEQWKELMGGVNELWRPIHEASVDMLKNASWWDYTVFGVVRRYRKQQQLAAQIVAVAANISAYLDEVYDALACALCVVSCVCGVRCARACH